MNKNLIRDIKNKVNKESFNIIVADILFKKYLENKFLNGGNIDSAHYINFFGSIIVSDDVVFNVYISYIPTEEDDIYSLKLKYEDLLPVDSVESLTKLIEKTKNKESLFI
jgi:hypothetical protein